MSQRLSERSLVSSDVPSQIGISEIVLHDDSESSDVLDVEEYSYTNRECVNLENAAVNIDNSNDVIIGPVTQFNVNGNVTIYQNGNRETPEAINDSLSQDDPQQTKFANGAKPARFEKTESEEKDLKKLVKYKNPIKILLLISVTLMVIAGIIVVVLQYTHKPEDIYNPTEPGDGSDNLGSHQVLDRTVWNGRPPKRVLNITSPVPMVIIKHTGGRTCDSLRVCAGIIQTIQSQCVTNGESDIYYNFLIGGDGNIYVGRGWDAQPAQRNDTIDIAFLGSYAFDTLTPTMIEAARMLIDDGHKKEKLTDDYIIVCHNQTMATESPGANVCAEVRTWPHYDPGTYFAPKLTTPSTTRVLKRCVITVAIVTLISLSAIIIYVILENMFRYEEGWIDRLGDHFVYRREDWGGQPARKLTPLQHPTGLVIISHSATNPCNSFATCSSRVRSFQNSHLSLNFDDIGYNFVIGGDGNVYVGRGWDVRNFHRQLSIGINFIGDFNFDQLNASMISVTKLLLEQGLQSNKLTENYILVGHNQSTPSVPYSPGENVYKEIKQWPHFKNIILFN